MQAGLKLLSLHRDPESWSFRYSPPCTVLCRPGYRNGGLSYARQAFSQLCYIPSPTFPNLSSFYLLI